MSLGPDAGERFRAAAAAFCTLLEVDPLPSLEALVGDLAPLLSELLTCALKLPPEEPLSDEPLPFAPNYDEVMGLRERLEVTFGSRDFYLVMYDPYETPRAYALDTPDAPVGGSLADDLADIWADLTGGLRALDAGADPREVVWTWRFLFTTHWGRHLQHALGPLLVLLWEGEDDI